VAAQKGKHMKRRRAWHHSGAGPDRAFQRALRALEQKADDRVPERWTTESKGWRRHG